MTKLKAAIDAFRIDALQPKKIPADEKPENDVSADKFPAATLPQRMFRAFIFCSVYAAVIFAAALTIPLLPISFMERARLEYRDDDETLCRLYPDRAELYERMNEKQKAYDDYTEAIRLLKKFRINAGFIHRIEEKRNNLRIVPQRR